MFQLNREFGDRLYFPIANFLEIKNYFSCKSLKSMFTLLDLDSEIIIKGSQ